MKTIRNTTALDILIADVGINVMAGATYAIPTKDYLLWANSIDVVVPVSNGSLVVNDGVGDLPVIEALRYLLYPDRARHVRFNTETNGFISKNVQDAIEEGVYRRIRATVSSSTEQNTTNTAFQVLNLMTLTIPNNGRYKLEFSARTETLGVNGEGAWAIFRQGVQVANTERHLACETNILGLITLSSNFIDGTTHIKIDLDCATNDVVDVRWRSVDGVQIRTVDRFFSYERVA